jgi:hypothetical protein
VDAGRERRCHDPAASRLAAAQGPVLRTLKDIEGNAVAELA